MIAVHRSDESTCLHIQTGGFDYTLPLSYLPCNPTCPAMEFCLSWSCCNCCCLPVELRTDGVELRPSRHKRRGIEGVLGKGHSDIATWCGSGWRAGVWAGSGQP